MTDPHQEARRAELLELLEDMQRVAADYGVEPNPKLYAELIARADLLSPASGLQHEPPSQGWKDSRGFVLPHYVSVVSRDDGGVVLEGHTATQDWELAIGPDGTAEQFDKAPVVGGEVDE